MRIERRFLYGSYEQFRMLQKVYNIPDEAFEELKLIPDWATHFAELVPGTLMPTKVGKVEEIPKEYGKAQSYNAQKEKRMIKRISTAIAVMTVSTALYAATPRQLFEKIGQPVMEKNPSINEFEVCIESVCETFYETDLPRRTLHPQMPGADPSQAGTGVADAVSSIIGSAAKSVGVGGRVVVDYEKKADGSVKVRVEASFGTGEGAGAAAAGGNSSSNPDNPYSK